jgi:hypothetical protein
VIQVQAWLPVWVVVTDLVARGGGGFGFGGKWWGGVVGMDAGSGPGNLVTWHKL